MSERSSGDVDLAALASKWREFAGSRGKDDICTWLDVHFGSFVAQDIGRETEDTLEGTMQSTQERLFRALLKAVDAPDIADALASAEALRTEITTEHDVRIETYESIDTRDLHGEEDQPDQGI